MSNSVKDIVSGSVLLILSIAMFIASFSIRRILPIGVSSAFFPKFIGIFLAFISVLIIVQGVMSYHKEREKNLNENIHKSGLVVLVTLFLLGFYVFSLDFLGFILTTLIYLIAQIGVLAPKDHRNWTIITMVSVIVSLGSYYSFYYFFHLILPSGFWG